MSCMSKFISVCLMFLVGASWLEPESHKPPLNVLLKMLQSDDQSKRIRAAAALGGLGTAGQPAISALKQSLHDSEKRVRSLSAISLLEIGAADEDALKN